MTAPLDQHETHRRTREFVKRNDEELFLQSFNEALANASDLRAPSAALDPSALPLIYIVGVPRSGTTLLSQLCSRYLELGYINNVIARFWLRPSVGIALSRVLLGENSRETIGLSSTHGVTSELAGPHEFGYYWSHWLRLREAQTHHLTPEELGAVDVDGLRESLEREILRPFGMPVLFKNPICGFQASFLTQLHPRTLFIHIRRDLFAAASSILSCRRRRFGSYDAWWSLKPSTYPFEDCDSDPVCEVYRQVRDCQEELETELSRQEVHSLDVEYEFLCKNPQHELNRIAKAVTSMYSDWDSGTIECPSLPVSKGVTLPDELKQRLRALFSKDQTE